MIYLGADHRGFKLKEEIKRYLKTLSFAYQDFGNKIIDPNDDYPDFAKKVAEKVSQNSKERGILFCGSGVGMAIVANKFKNVRAVLGFNEKVAQMSREHNDSNVLSLPTDFLSLKETKKIVKTWLKTKFSQDGRHKKRLRKIKSLEKKWR